MGPLAPTIGITYLRRHRCKFSKVHNDQSGYIILINDCDYFIDEEEWSDQISKKKEKHGMHSIQPVFFFFEIGYSNQQLKLFHLIPCIFFRVFASFSIVSIGWRSSSVLFPENVKQIS